MEDAQIRSFRREVYRYYRAHRRDFPWRRIGSLSRNTLAYRVLISEVMLQQTQADRVVPKYRAFIRTFPSFRALSDAPLSEVLRLWQGLGYNRRAKHLKEAAAIVVRAYRGRLPDDEVALVALPGIGRYTAGAIRAFAFDAPAVFIETNIRTVFLHHFFPNRKRVSDRALLPLIEAACDAKRPREWYSALMDYGAELKRAHGNPGRRSAHHKRQTSFKGSRREVRGAIVRALALNDALSLPRLLKIVQENIHARRTPLCIMEECTALENEGLIMRKKGVHRLAP